MKKIVIFFIAIIFISSVSAQNFEFKINTGQFIVKEKNEHLNTTEFTFLGKKIQVSHSKKEFSNKELEGLMQSCRCSVVQVQDSTGYRAIVDTNGIDDEEIDSFREEMMDGLKENNIPYEEKNFYTFKNEPLGINPLKLEEGTSTKKKVNYFYRIQLFATRTKLPERDYQNIIEKLNTLLFIEEQDNRKYTYSYLLAEKYSSRSEAKIKLKEVKKKYYKDAYIVEYKVFDIITHTIESVRITN